MRSRRPSARPTCARLAASAASMTCVGLPAERNRRRRVAPVNRIGLNSQSRATTWSESTTRWPAAILVAGNDSRFQARNPWFSFSFTLELSTTVGHLLHQLLHFFSKLLSKTERLRSVSMARRLLSFRCFDDRTGREQTRHAGATVGAGNENARLVDARLRATELCRSWDV